MRALAYALVSAFVAALAMWTGGSFLRADFTDSLHKLEDAEARMTAKLVGAMLENTRARERQMLEVLCKREINLERLEHELNAGPVDTLTVSRAADHVVHTLGHGYAALVQVTNGRVNVLGKSADFPALALSEELVREAKKREILVQAEGSVRGVALACALRAPQRALLYIASLDAEMQTLRALGLRQELTLELERHAQPGAALAFSRSDLSDNALAVTVQPAPPITTHLDLALWVVTLSAFLIAGTFGFFTGRRVDRHEQALLTIETAARRVAQGDLVSAIGLRNGDRADQTFQTFDRMTKELREMRERLAEAEREAAFREVSRRIAHEIKNPLSPIRMAIETLRRAKERERADFGEIFDESTRAILEEVKRLERIVREFGEFARLPKPVKSAFDLGELVRDTVSLYVPEDVELELVLDAQAPRVRADREQVTQVLINVLQNALDASKQSAVRRLRITVEEGASCTRLTIEDNGPGIAVEDRERVFEPYYTTKEEGTGLGLAIVRRILADHRGTIELGEGGLGGASVRLTLPNDDGATDTRA